MKFIRLISPILLLSFFITVRAQTETTDKTVKSKEQIALEDKTYKLLTEAANDAAQLKLAENRAFAYGIIGNLYWDKDEKIARQMFSSAVAELIKALNDPKKRSPLAGENKEYYWTQSVQNLLRGGVVYNILQRDPENALRTFYATRTEEIENAVQFYRETLKTNGATPANQVGVDEQKLLNMANLEISLEENIKKLTEKDDPQALAKNLREKIAAGREFYGIIDKLAKLNEKDNETAQKILDEYVLKLLDESYLPDVKSYLIYDVYEKFVRGRKKSASAKDKVLEVDEKKIKTIANREYDKLLSNDPVDTFRFAEHALSLKRVLPERYAELKPKLDKLKHEKPRIDDDEATEKLGSEPTIDQINSYAAKLYSSTRTNYYNAAVRKLVETESAEKIAATLEKIPNKEERDKAFELFKSLTAEKLKESKTEDAEKSALEIKNEKEKIVALVKLADFYYSKNTEADRKNAEDLLRKASAFANLVPETRTEFDKFLPLIEGYARIKPATAFEMIAPIIGKSNDLIDAYIMMANYNDNNYPYASENEIVFAAQETFSSFGRYAGLLKNLATNDFERTTNLIENFRRADIRIAAKLVLAQNILKK